MKDRSTSKDFLLLLLLFFWFLSSKHLSVQPVTYMKYIIYSILYFCFSLSQFINSLSMKEGALFWIQAFKYKPNQIYVSLWFTPPPTPPAPRYSTVTVTVHNSRTTCEHFNVIKFFFDQREQVESSRIFFDHQLCPVSHPSVVTD